MKKRILVTPVRKLVFLTGQALFILVFAVSLIGWPLAALAVDEVSIAEDTDLYLYTSGYTVKVMSGSLCDEIIVYGTYLTVTLSANSSVELRSYDRRTLNNSLATTDCGYPNYCSLILPGQSSETIITVTPSSTTNPAPSGGGGGGAIVSAPATATGLVTATAAGGKTTVTTGEGTKASVELPAKAVIAQTDIRITPKTKADIVASRPVPSEKSTVSGYVYNFTATSGGVAVTTFAKNITLTLTYTDEQITGLNEDTLKIHFWDDTQWVGLTSTVDKENNKVTAMTDHFTYFVIMGDPETPSGMAKPEDYGLTEGDLVRAEGDFDIFIISQYGYKRLFLNPVIFEMYGHLGSWDDVKTITIATRDAFITSTHYRYVNEDKVYHLEVTGEDTGNLQWIDMTAEDFLAQGGESLAIFTINKSELDWYPKAGDKTSL